MLLLNRKIDEQIAVIIPPSDKPQALLITVTSITPSCCRLGFEGDESIRIHRLEVLEAIARGERVFREKPAVLPLIRIGDALPGERI